MLRLIVYIVHMVMWSDMLKGHIFKEQWNWESMNVYILSQCIVHVVAFNDENRMVWLWDSVSPTFFVALFYSDGQRICIQEYICLCGTVWTWRLQGKICVYTNQTVDRYWHHYHYQTVISKIFLVLLTNFRWHGRNIPDIHVYGLRICCCHAPTIIN